MSTTPTLPELRAAAVAASETTPVVTPVAPVVPAVAGPTTPEPYTITESPDGTVHVKLDTGEEFKGSWKEVGPKLAKSKHDSSAYAKELKAKLDAGAPPVVAATAAAAAQLSTELAAAKTPQEIEQAHNKYFALLSSDPKKFAVQALADEWGIEPEEMTSFVKDLFNNRQLQRTENVISTFRQKASDFPATPENLTKLGEFMDANEMPFNAGNMRAAWVLMKEDPSNAVKPLSPEQVTQLLTTTYAQQTGLKVPPIPQSNASPVSVPSENPWTMDMSKLREQALKVSK